MGEEVNPEKLENLISLVVGEQEEKPGWEYYETYTGLNLFYHELAGTGSATNANNVPTQELEGLGKFEFVDKKESYDEQGDLDEELIFKFTNLDGEEFIYKKYGALDSWEGGIWDGALRLTRSVEKTIKVWEDYA